MNISLTWGLRAMSHLYNNAAKVLKWLQKTIFTNLFSFRSIVSLLIFIVLLHCFKSIANHISPFLEILVTFSYGLTRSSSSTHYSTNTLTIFVICSSPAPQICKTNLCTGFDDVYLSSAPMWDKSQHSRYKHTVIQFTHLTLTQHPHHSASCVVWWLRSSKSIFRLIASVKSSKLSPGLFLPFSVLFLPLV